MTPKQMKEIIEATATQYKVAGVQVKIDRTGRMTHSSTNIAIDGAGISFFAQDDDASQFIEDADKASDKFGVSSEDALLWQLDSAGAISPPKVAISPKRVREEKIL